jgi:hypothetical protein
MSAPAWGFMFDRSLCRHILYFADETVSETEFPDPKPQCAGQMESPPMSSRWLAMEGERKHSMEWDLSHGSGDTSDARTSPFLSSHLTICCTAVSSVLLRPSVHRKSSTACKESVYGTAGSVRPPALHPNGPAGGHCVAFIEVAISVGGRERETGCCGIFESSRKLGSS